MKLEEFIGKHGLIISEEINRACADGLALMRASQEPAHSERHIEDIISLLDEFLGQAKEIDAGRINYEILLPAICWHDIWKSSRPLATNFIKFRFEQYWDGIGSARLFKKYCRKNNLPRALAKNIRFAILHHNDLFFSLKKTGECQDHIEARLLDDLDSLDFWSLKRLEYAASAYVDENYKFYNPRLVPLFNWALDKFTQKIVTFSFDWSEREFSRRKEEVLDKCEAIMKLNRQ